jgi:hypothetical protein
MNKSAAIFRQQLADWVPDMFSNIYFAKNHKITNNWTPAEARDENKRRFKILRIFFDVGFTKYKTIKFCFIRLPASFLRLPSNLLGGTPPLKYSKC